ncbi:receptor protein-tyrosine kinase [Elysia marginata]|uniref:receptor protein-tyrosine kinase n=1 Tax=Elysia marginata TaxID=1093978 RepID=A0AAV4FGD7_9GAST|nr:receptor protein-tyrosine kinase [Elysia marginata]
MALMWSSSASVTLLFCLLTDHPLLTFVFAGGTVNSSTSEQSCIQYTGSFCNNYLKSVYVQTPAIIDGRDSTPQKALADSDQLLAAHMKDLTRLGLFSGQQGQDICMKPARRIMCHLNFPTCHVPEAGAGQKPATVLGQPLPICRESCQAVTQLFCFRQLARIKLLKKDQILTGTVGLLGMPTNCSKLPSKLDKGPASGVPACVESDHYDYAPEKVSDTCYIEQGRWYNGTVSVTKNGLTCQRWDQVSPHDHNRLALIYPEVQDAANFCRNPGGEEPLPWCYTTDPGTRYEHCDIKPCESGYRKESGGGGLGKRDDSTHDGHGLHMLLLIIGLPFGLVIVIFSLVMVCLCCRRRKYSSTPADEVDVDVDVEGLTVNSAYYSPTRLNPKLEAIEFPRNDLVFMERIGQGAFGLVFKARVVCSNGNSRLGGGNVFGSKLSSGKQSLGFGDNKPGRYKRNAFSSKGELQHIEFHDPLAKTSCDSKLLSSDHNTNELQLPGKVESGGGDEGEGQIVAVKMLKEDAAESVQTDFEREASLMVEFEHENIVRLLGVCTLGRPLCLLFEYMCHGDLNDYLQLCSPDRCLMRPLPNITHTESPKFPSIRSRGDSSHSLETADHLHIARQVCGGMVYLSDRGYVHRDLATRNCLVGDNLTVKISDFGLARNVHSMDYYRGSDRDAVPIRWMPPEAILYNKFSSQSDVWSFGVLLWEVFSYAFQPYYGLTHEEVIAALRAGRTLDPPEAAPPAVYSLMKSCWRMKPSSRPSFSSLHKCLVSMHEEACRTKAGVGNMHL